MDRPVIFLSAVSAEFRELRQLLHDSFKTHFHVITQDDTLHKFPGGDVRQLLSDAIDGSHAVLHLAGAGFGSTAAAPLSEMPGFLCSWTQYEYYYAHSFDADPVHRKQIFAIVCGPTLRNPTFTEKDDATLTAAQKAPLQEAHCQRIFSGKFDATPLASLPRTVNHGQPINDNAAVLRAAIDICAQLATRQPAFQSACALVQVSLQDQLQPLLLSQQEIKRDTTHLRRALLWLVGLLILATGIGWRTLRDTGQIAKDAVISKEQDLKQTKLLETLVAAKQDQTRAYSQQGRSISEIPQQEIEADLARRLSMPVEILRTTITAGLKSADALTRSRAELLAGKLDDAIATATEVKLHHADVIRQLIEADDIIFAAHYVKGDYRAALTARQRIAALIDPEREPLAWADAQDFVAVLMMPLSRYAEAANLERRVIAIKELHLDPTDLSLAISRGNLAASLVLQGEFAEVEPLYRRIIEAYETKLGRDNSNVAYYLSQLAVSLQYQGKLAEVEPLYRQAIAIGMANLGKDHSDVASDINNLAGVLQDQGKLAEAESLFRRGLGIIFLHRKRNGTPFHGEEKMVKNYSLLLEKMQRTPEEIQSEILTIQREAGLGE